MLSPMNCYKNTVVIHDGINGNHRAYELLSMGAESIYQGKYDLYSDEDMAKFILGLLLKG